MSWSVHLERAASLEEQLSICITAPASWSALFDASASGYLGEVKRLLKRGAEINPFLGPEAYAAAYQEASKLGFTQHICQSTLTAKIERDLQARGTPLHAAAQDGHRQILLLLLKHGAKVNATDSAAGGGTTPLFLAAQYGHAAVVKELLKAGADPDILDAKGRSALIIATACGHVECVKELLKHASGPEAGAMGTNAEGWTPLHVAAQVGNAPIARLLLERGADVHRLETQGHSPLAIAVIHGQVELIELLLEAGADMNMPNSRVGLLPIHAACSKGKVNSVKCLLQHGADINATNVAELGGVQVQARGLSPLLMAIQAGHSDVAAFLILHGADLDQMSSVGRSPRSLLCSGFRGASFEGMPPSARGLVAAAEAGRTGRPAVTGGGGAASAGDACWACGVQGVPLKRCSGCVVVGYCGKVCQAEDWRTGGHKSRCAILREERTGDRVVSSLLGSHGEPLRLQTPGAKQTPCTPEIKRRAAEAAEQLRELLQQPLPFSGPQEAQLHQLLVDVMPAASRPVLVPSL